MLYNRFEAPGMTETKFSTALEKLSDILVFRLDGRFIISHACGDNIKPNIPSGPV